MLPTMFGCAAQGSGPSPLAVSVQDVDPLQFIVPPGQSGATSNPGDFGSLATATGGDGSYSYSWSITELGDPDNAFSVASSGTTDQASYGDATISTNFAQTNPPSNPPPQIAGYRLSCTVTDGTGATATASADFDVEVIT